MLNGISAHTFDQVVNVEKQLSKRHLMYFTTALIAKVRWSSGWLFSSCFAGFHIE